MEELDYIEPEEKEPNIGELISMCQEYLNGNEENKQLFAFVMLSRTVH